MHPNEGTWLTASDRALKEHFQRVDPRDILAKVANLPIASWNYIGAGGDIRHMGPVAQDFRAAFGLGFDDKTIATVDADGVALVAIQGLNQMMQQKDAKLQQQSKEISTLKRKLQAIEAKLGL